MIPKTTTARHAAPIDRELHGIDKLRYRLLNNTIPDAAGKHRAETVWDAK